jgi:TonB-dependent Receptor Plug Domain
MKKAFVLSLLSIFSLTLWAQEKSDVNISKEKKQHPKPLIVINGLKMNQGDSIGILDTIDPSIISSVDVLKGDQGIEKFGTDGERGVVIIETSSRTQFEPLYFVDGKEVDNLKGINPNDIGSMEVVKDLDKLIKYGDRAQRGAIFIKMKNY